MTTSGNSGSSDAAIIVKYRHTCHELFKVQVQEWLRHGQEAVDFDLLYEQMQTKNVTVRVRTSNGKMHEPTKEQVLGWIKQRLWIHVQEKIALDKANTALIQSVVSNEGAPLSSSSLGTDPSIDKALGTVTKLTNSMASSSVNPDDTNVQAPNDTTAVTSTDGPMVSLQHCLKLLQPHVQMNKDKVLSNIFISNDADFLRLGGFAVSHCLRIGELDKEYIHIVFQEMKEQKVSFYIRTGEHPHKTTDPLRDDSALGVFQSAILRVMNNEEMLLSSGMQAPSRSASEADPTDDAVINHKSTEERIVAIITRDLRDVSDDLQLILRKDHHEIQAVHTVTGRTRKSRYRGVFGGMEGNNWWAQIKLKQRKIPCKFYWLNMLTHWLAHFSSSVVSVTSGNFFF